jgi:hypothetical protein
MTRINCGIPPVELEREHLIAELREITRPANKIKSGKFSMEGQPSEFKLGEGHEKFFYDKIKYLHKRYVDLYHEAKFVRKYNVRFFGNAFKGIPDEYYNDYEPTERDRNLVRKRIADRLSGIKYQKK